MSNPGPSSHLPHVSDHKRGGKAFDIGHAERRFLQQGGI